MNDQTKPLFAGINVQCMPELPANTMLVSPDIFDLLKDPKAAAAAQDKRFAEAEARFAEVCKALEGAGWKVSAQKRHVSQNPNPMQVPKGSAPASSHQVIDARAPATHPKPADEKAYLQEMIFKLMERGWKPCAYNDGGGHMTIDTAVHGVHWIIEQVSGVDHAWLKFKNADGNIKTVLLVWGNDPHGEELFADHAIGHGFDEAVDACHKELFPED